MTRSAAPSTASTSGLSRWRAAVAAAALACFATTLLARGWIRDDRWLIAENPLLRQGWAAAPAVLRTGYWEAAVGPAAPIQEYRPLATLSYLAQLSLTGRRPAPFHAVNALLHAAVCLLLLECLRRRLPLPAAGAAALVFAVLPVHAEAVSYLTSRSELLCALSLLGCWLLVGGRGQPRTGWAAVCFAAGLLSKESAVLIPAFLALEDWVFESRRPWDQERRDVSLMFLGALAAYAAARLAVVPRSGAGVPYFATRLDALMVWPAWTLRHYLWPSLTGAGLCADFTRAGAGLSLSDPPILALWLARLLPAIPVLFAHAALRRARWAFWLVGPLLFLLPTCPVLVPLDAIGSERFLYIPTIALAVALGSLYARGLETRPAAARSLLAAVTLTYAALLVRRNGVWLSERAHYAAACACNPASARAYNGLGEAVLAQGDAAGGRAAFERARALDPALAAPVYNLALLAYNGGDASRAEALAREAVARDAASSDAWLLLALSLEKRGAPKAEQEAALRRALTLLPDNAAAELDLGRFLLATGRAPEAAQHLRRFVQLAPDDPDAAGVAALLGGRP